MAVTDEQIEKIITLAKGYGAVRLILFGGAVESPGKPRDIDLACDGVPGWDLYSLAARLEGELRTPLDIIPLSTPSPFTRLIENSGRVIYDSRQA